jgi:hypothetical protein
MFIARLLFFFRDAPFCRRRVPSSAMRVVIVVAI